MYRPFYKSFFQQFFLKSLQAGLILCCAPLAALAGQNVALNWNPSGSADVAGYKIYYGTASGNYTASITVGNVTNTVLANLPEGTTYFFAATTYDDSGVESDFSNEATFSIPQIINLPETNSTPTNSPVQNPPLTNSVPPTSTVQNPIGTTTTTTTTQETTLPPTSTVVTLPVTNPPVVLNLPTLNPINDLTIAENSKSQTIVLNGISAGIVASRKATLKVSVASSNSRLIKSSVSYTSPKNTGKLTLSPIAHATGSAVITVTINNGSKNNNLFSQSFTVTVLPISAPVTAPPVNSNPVTSTPVVSSPPANSSPATSSSGNVATTSSSLLGGRFRNNLQAPTFSAPLADTVALTGKTVSLQAPATGQAPLSYQWKFNGAPLSGATSATLTLKNVKPAESGIYTVTVSNPVGSVSLAAQVAVYDTTAATLASAARAENGNFRLHLDGIPGSQYVVEASTDLVHWQAVETNSAPFTFEDSQTSSFGQRYYRSYCISQ